MNIHPRSDWATVAPRSSTPLVPAEVRGVAVHWLGPPANASDPAKLLRGIQAYHLGKGWSDIAYNIAVDPAGDLWVLRGTGVRSAANGDTDPNRRYVAVVALLGEGQKPTPAMLDGLRAAVALVQARYPKATEVRTHNDVRPDPTACPGPDLTAAIRAGRLAPIVAAALPKETPAVPDPNVYPWSAAPIAILAHPQGGYWIIGADGGVANFGGSPFIGSLGGQPISAPVVSASLTPSGRGFYLLGRDGAVYAFGDAQYAGRVLWAS